MEKSLLGDTEGAKQEGNPDWDAGGFALGGTGHLGVSLLPFERKSVQTLTQKSPFGWTSWHVQGVQAAVPAAWDEVNPSHAAGAGVCPEAGRVKQIQVASRLF